METGMADDQSGAALTRAAPALAMRHVLELLIRKGLVELSEARTCMSAAATEIRERGRGTAVGDSAELIALAFQIETARLAAL